MPVWEELLRGIIVFDGAMGTMLQAAGLGAGVCPELWNLNNPGVVAGIHRAYAEAGAMVVETNTFGASPLKLKDYGLEKRCLEINEAAARLAKQAVQGKALVAGSVGPTGLLMEPYGPASFDAFYEAFAEQIRGLAAGGADLICIETMSDLGEIKAALLAAKNCCRLPVICSMTFDKNGRTMMGITPENAAYVLEAAGADAVGANCSTGPGEMLEVLRRMAKVTALPLFAAPNAGLPVLKEGRFVYIETPQEFAACVQDFAAAGVKLLGGCCGTTPGHISAIAQAAGDLRAIGNKVNCQTVLSSRRRLVVADATKQAIVIGTCCHAVQQESILKDLQTGNLDSLVAEASAQVQGGAQAINLKLSEAGLEDPLNMYQAVLKLQSRLDVPVVIQSNCREVAEAGLKALQGRGALNTAMVDADSLEQFIGLAKKYGAIAILRTPAEKPASGTAERVKAAGGIVKQALSLGLTQRDIMIDCNVYDYLEQGRLDEAWLVNNSVKKEYGVQTVLALPAVLLNCLAGLDQEKREAFWAKARQETGYICFDPRWPGLVG